MAGDWIKIEHVTPDKPEVHRMAHILNIAPEEVFGRLVRVWIWADQQSLNGHALSVTRNAISHVARRDNFAQAMEQVGWLTGQDGELTFPNFDNHNTETAKARALANKRQDRRRGKNVTLLSRAGSDKSVTREEKRREEEEEVNTGTATKPAKTFRPPTLEEVRAYCQERRNTVNPEAWLDHYSSNGWRVGKNPMKDWRAAVRTWERNNFAPAIVGKPTIADALAAAKAKQAERDAARRAALAAEGRS